MHGLRTIKKLNSTEQNFIDHILNQPRPEINLLQVWNEWKQEQTQTTELEITNEI